MNEWPPGVGLCPRHATQVAKELREPEGPCDVPTWLNGFGETFTCDAVARPEHVARFLADKRESAAEQGRKAARRG